jgi:hypothetical protein
MERPLQKPPTSWGVLVSQARPRARTGRTERLVPRRLGPLAARAPARNPAQSTVPLSGMPVARSRWQV